MKILTPRGYAKSSAGELYTLTAAGFPKDIPNFRGAHAYRSTSVNISDATYTEFTFTTEIFDTDGFFTPSGKYLVVPAGMAGFYMIGANITWGTNNTGLRQARMFVNSGSVTINDARQAVQNAATSQSMWGIHELAEEDTVSLSLWQNSGGALAVTAAHIYALFLGKTLK